MANLAKHPLDPLANHYVLLSPENGKERAMCRHCPKIFRTAQMNHLRGTIKRHVTEQHQTIDIDAYVMTKEDYDLDADFEVLGKPNSNPLQYRKYICFDFDSNAKRSSFVYCLISEQLLTKPELTKTQRDVQPRIDIFLTEADRMKIDDYTGKVLPEDYEKGHLIGLGLARFSLFIHDVINAFSDVAIQHGQLNHGLWHYLEELIEGLLLNYKVRVMVGTKGHLDLPCSSRAQVPRWWWIIIVTSDEDDANWRYSAFLFPNISCEENLDNYQVTIYQLIAIVGCNIFPKVIHELQTKHRSDIAPAEFEQWAMAKWFPPTPTTGDTDESDDDEVSPSKKKKTVAPLVISSDED